MPTTESSPGGSKPSCEHWRFAQNSCKCTKHLLLPQKPHARLGAGPSAPRAAPALLPPAARAAPAGLDPREWLNPQPLSCKNPTRGIWDGNTGLGVSSVAQPCSELQQHRPNHPCKKSLTRSCCISLSVLENQSQPWFVAGAASSAPPAPKFTGFQLCYCTQARRCINVISSCKGQQVRPRAALSSFVLLLSFLGCSRGWRDGNCHKTPQNSTA